MILRKGLRIRLYPTPEQEDLFRRTAGICRAVYNVALEQRSAFWRQYKAVEKRSLGYASQAAELSALKAEFPWVREAPHHCLQQALRDLDRAFVNFFEGRAKYPTHRRKGRDDSFRFPDRKQFRLDLTDMRSKGRGAVLHLPKAGAVRCVLHRPLDPGAVVKSVTVSRDGDWWVASLQIETEVADPQVRLMLPLGIDLGIVNQVVTSEGTVLDLALMTPAEREHEARLRRSIAAKVRGSANRRKAVAKLARFLARMARRRKDLMEKVTTRLAKSHGLLVVEDLNVLNMTASARGTVEEPGTNVRQKAGLNRSLLDLSPGLFRRRLEDKVRACGGVVIAVDPRNTSRQCSACGHTSANNRPSRDVFRCERCGHEMDADVNAAINIRRRALVLNGSAVQAHFALMGVVRSCRGDMPPAGGLPADACGDDCVSSSTKQEPPVAILEGRGACATYGSPVL